MRFAPRRLLLSLVFVGSIAAGTAGHAQTVAPEIVLTASAQTAWGRVRQALTPQQQATEVRSFLAVLANGNGRRVAPPVDARDIASGRAVSLDDPALVQRPQAHEVTLTVGGQFLVFRPLSRASLEPFLGR